MSGSTAREPRVRRRRRGGPPGEPRAIAWLYVAPALAVYGAFMLYPFVRSIQISLYDWDGLSLGTWVGLGNYSRIAQDEQLRAAFGHTLVLMLFFAVLPLVVGLLLAAVLNRARVRGLSFFRTVVFLPQVVAMVVVAVAWKRIYALDGSLDSFLRAVGLGGMARSWLGDYTLALPAVGVVGTWFEIGLVTVLMLGGMAQVDTSLYEAARLDGAGPVREFFAITLPAVRGEVSVALTLTVIAALKTFDLIYVTTSGGPGNQTSVPSYQVFHQAFDVGRVGLACAIGVTLTVIVFVISFLITRFVEPRDS